MKKFFKEHDLFKILLFMVILVTLLTWFIPTGSFTSGVFTDAGILRIGIFDFFLSAFYSCNYFLLQILFLFVVGGLYGILSKTKGYATLVNRIAKSMKGKEILFVIIISLLFAAFTSFNNELLVGFLAVPFVINIFKKANIDKMTTFCSTFGAILIGLVGATFSAYGFDFINSYLGITNTDGIWWKVGFFVLSFALLMVYTVMHMNNKKKNVEFEDKYEVIEVKETKGKKKTKVWPFVLVLSILAVISVTGYISWSTELNITWFTDVYNDMMAFQIGDVTIFAYLFGSLKAMGEWDIFTITMITVIFSYILSIIGGMKFNEFLDEFANGAKKMVKPVLLYTLAHAVFVISYWSPILPTITNKLIASGSNFNLFALILVALIAAILNIDHGFTGYSIASYIAAVYSTKLVESALVLNTMYAFVQLIAPTSVLLFIGLSYLDIKYIDYLKHMWKFLLGIFCAIILLLVIMIYV